MNEIKKHLPSSQSSKALPRHSNVPPYRVVHRIEAISAIKLKSESKSTNKKNTYQVCLKPFLLQYFAVPPRVHMDSTGLHWTPVDSSGLYPKLNIDMFGKDYLCHMSRVRVRMVLLFCLSYSAFFSIRKAAINRI